MRMFAEHLRHARVPRRRVTLEHATDLLCTHMEPRLHLWLVNYRGWSGRRYEAWYTQVMTAALIQADGDRQSGCSLRYRRRQRCGTFRSWSTSR
jgi:hypothetical protein